MKFGKCELLESTKTSGKLAYITKCDCGVISIIRYKTLQRPGFHGCKSCTSKNTYNLYTKDSWDSKRTKYVGDISGTFYSHIKQGARSRKIPFDVTKEFIWNLFIAQNKLCNLSGREITLSTDRKKSDPDFSKISASLDRIDSKKGYTTDNVQWVHKHVNKAKWDMDDKDFIAMCKEVAKFQNEKEN